MQSNPAEVVVLWLAQHQDLQKPSVYQLVAVKPLALSPTLSPVTLIPPSENPVNLYIAMSENKSCLHDLQLTVRISFHGLHLLQVINLFSNSTSGLLALASVGLSPSVCQSSAMVSSWPSYSPCITHLTSVLIAFRLPFSKQSSGCKMIFPRAVKR